MMRESVSIFMIISVANDLGIKIAGIHNDLELIPTTYYARCVVRADNAMRSRPVCPFASVQTILVEALILSHMRSILTRGFQDRLALHP